MSGIDILFNTHVGAITEGQTQLSDRIGSSAWEIDFGKPRGHLTIGGEAFDIQLVGTESHGDNTWLWAWANQSDVPADLLQLAFRMQAHGVEHGATDLIEPMHPLSRIDGHTASVAIAGTVGMNAYFPCTYEGGALFVAIADQRLVAQTPPLLRFATYYPAALASYEVHDHRMAARGYADHLGLQMSDVTADSLTVLDRQTSASMVVAFDEHGRMTEIAGSIAA